MGIKKLWALILVVIFLLLLSGCATTTARTPLMRAVSEGDSNAVKGVLDSGVNVNEQSDYDIGPGGKSWTALHLAAKRGDVKMVRLLLDYGADPGITTGFGWTPLDWADHQGNTFAANMIREAMEKRYMSAEKMPAAVSERPLMSSEVDVLPRFGDEHRIIGDNDRAVVIGIEKYQDLPQSDYSRNDAKTVKGYLKALGFLERNIEYIVDERATKSSIEKSIEAWLPNQLKKGGTVFVYYSGHGAPDPVTGEAFIVPYDGDPNYLSVTGYPLKRLYERLAQLETKEIIVVIDSCFSGSGGRSVLAKGVRPLVMMTNTRFISANMVVLTASQGSQISTSSPEKGHGVFTYYFLEALKDGKKDVAEIYAYIKPLVEDEARAINVQQTPSLSPGAERLKGRFVLMR